MEHKADESMAELLAARSDAIRALRRIVSGELATTPWERTRAIQMILNHTSRPYGETDPHEVEKQLPRPRRKRTAAMLAGMERAPRYHSLLGSGLDNDDS